MSEPKRTCVQVLLEVIHREDTENSGCVECGRSLWPCRTMRLLDVGADMDRRGVDLNVRAGDAV